jgi:hypothetical protein
MPAPASSPESKPPPRPWFLFVPLGLIFGAALRNPLLGVAGGTLLMAAATTWAAWRAGRRISPVIPVGLVVCAAALAMAGLVTAGVIRIGN